MTDILDITGLQVDQSRTRETSQQLIVGVSRRSNTDQICFHCYSADLAPNGARIVNYADLPIRGKLVTLEWERQRFRCRNCGKTAPDDHSAFHDEFRMTNRLYEWVTNRCLTHTFSSVAADVGLDERSVRRVFEHWSEDQLKDLVIETPRIMGIDEVHLLNAARGIITNIGKRTLVDLLPNRDYDTMTRRISKMPALHNFGKTSSFRSKQPVLPEIAEKHCPTIIDSTSPKGGGKKHQNGQNFQPPH